MATLKIFKKPADFQLPQSYTKKNLSEETSTASFLNKIDSEIDGFDKYIIGRYYEKKYKILKPGETGVTEEEVTKPATFICHVYVPKTGEDILIYVVGSNSELLFPELLAFANLQKLTAKTIDMATLEKKSFTSGIINLIGHKYNQANDTISYTVRKIDGIPFNSQDPDYVSCEETDKDILEVKINVQGSPATFYVYSDGKITRRGPDESGTTPFALLKTVYDIIAQEIESK